MKGASLVEFMIASCISSMMMVGLFSCYLSAVKMDVEQNALNEIYENSMAFSSIVGPHIQHAGWYGCRTFLQDVSFHYNDPQLASRFNLQSRNSVDVLSGIQLQTNAAVPKKIKQNHKVDTDAIWLNRVENSFHIEDPDLLDKGKIKVKGRMEVNRNDVLVMGNFAYVFVFEAINCGRYNAINDYTLIHFERNQNIPYSKMKNLQVGKLQSLVFYVGKTNRTFANAVPVYALYQANMNGHIQEVIQGVDNLKVKRHEDNKLEFIAGFHSLALLKGTERDRPLRKEYTYRWRTRV